MPPLLGRGGLLLWLAALACAGRSPDRRIRGADIATTPPPGRLVDIGGYRLHLHCTGEGSPTVILEAGAGAFSIDWSLVQPAVARVARVCSYDRAGLGWSEPGPSRRGERAAEELERLLARAGERPPWLLVGHSYGGIYVRIYQHKHPEQVAGMVLIDPTHEDGLWAVGDVGLPPRLVRLREYADDAAWEALFADAPPVADAAPAPPPPDERWTPPPADQLPRAIRGLPVDLQYLRASARARSASRKADFEERDNHRRDLAYLFAARAGAQHPLGNLPTTVILPPLPEHPEPDLSADEQDRLRRHQESLRRDFMGLSVDTRVVDAQGVGHQVQIERPDLVGGAIAALVEEVRRDR